MQRSLLFLAAVSALVFALPACSGGESCSGIGEMDCPSGCVNTLTDKSNCGGCGNVCLGSALCEAGDCVCSSGLNYCDGACANYQTDDQNCGGCAQPCNTGSHCIQGRCVVPYDESCDGADNDFDGQTDEGTNGQALTRACDNLCGPGTETCSAGRWANCTAPRAGTETCNQKDDDCDGQTDEDVATRYYEDYDGDGYGDPDEAYSVLACSQPAPGSGPNGGDMVLDHSDCNDGYECPGVPDCDFTQIYPGATEACDGVDNDCDNAIDDGCGCTAGSSQECGTDLGECTKGTQTCTGGTWGPCGGAGYVGPAASESCNGKDDDCDGTTDEEMADDSWENNDTCATARTLADLFEDEGPLVVNGASMYHGASAAQDADWYLVRAVEASHLDCLWNPGKKQCNFIFEATFKVPAAATHADYQMCVHSGTCGAFDYNFCTDASMYDTNSQSYVMALAWEGICGLDDSWDFYVEIKYTTPNAIETCLPYDLDFDFTYQGPIADSCE